MNHLFIPRALFVDDTTIHMHNLVGATMMRYPGQQNIWSIWAVVCNKLMAWQGVVDDFGNLVAVK